MTWTCLRPQDVKYEKQNVQVVGWNPENRCLDSMESAGAVTRRQKMDEAVTRRQHQLRLFREHAMKRKKVALVDVEEEEVKESYFVSCVINALQTMSKHRLRSVQLARHVQTELASRQNSQVTAMDESTFELNLQLFKTQSKESFHLGSEWECWVLLLKPLTVQELQQVEKLLTKNSQSVTKKEIDTHLFKAEEAFKNAGNKKERCFREERMMNPATVPITHYQNVCVPPVSNLQDPTQVALATIIAALQVVCKQRPDFEIGVTKSHKDHGNSSVSMGVAVKKRKANPNLKKIGCCNFGSEGLTWQDYIETETGGFREGKVWKPRKEFPNIQDEKNSAESVAKSMQVQLDIMWPLDSTGKRDVDEIFLFITGTLRDKFYKAWNENDHGTASALLKRAFEVCSGVGDSYDGLYYIEQEVEAELEFEAVFSLYRSLLDKDPTAVVGIGGSSTQVGSKKGSTNFKVGMNSGRPDSLFETHTRIAEAILALDLPMGSLIALKSGCLLAMNFNKGNLGLGTCPSVD